MKPNLGDYREEAVDFLRQSLRDHHDSKWKFAVLHGSMAVEMLLKERLVKVNPGAVLERVDDPQCKTTVAMGKIIPRLDTFGITLDANDKTLIDQITEWRNDVAHRKLLATKAEVEKKLAGIYKFFAEFLDNELEVEIKEALGEDYREFRELLKEWEEIEKEAQEEASEAGYVDNKSPSATFDCAECWGISDTVAYVDGKAHCFLCDQDFDSATCSRCGEAIIGERESEEEGPTWCESCTENMFGKD